MRIFVFILEKIVFPIVYIFFTPLIIYKLVTKEILFTILEIILDNKTSMTLITELAKETNLILLITMYIIWLPLQLNYFHNKNKDDLFNSNGTIYYNFNYCLFWIASRILGYGKIQLAGIPISMQYKLVLRSTFKETLGDYWETHYSETDDVRDESGELKQIIKSKYSISNPNTENLNLFIMDTYNIAEDSIAQKYKENDFVEIISTLNDSGRRYKNRQLVQKVREVVNVYSTGKKYKNIFVFSTANPMNNLDIISSSFRLFGKKLSCDIIFIEWNKKTNNYSKEVKIIS